MVVASGQWVCVGLSTTSFFAVRKFFSFSAIAHVIVKQRKLKTTESRPDSRLQNRTYLGSFSLGTRKSCPAFNCPILRTFSEEVWNSFFGFPLGLNLQFLWVVLVLGFMENSQDLCNVEGDGDARKATACTSSASSVSSGGSGFRLFGRQASVHQCMGGGKGKIFLTYSFISAVQFASFAFGFL